MFRVLVLLYVLCNVLCEENSTEIFEDDFGEYDEKGSYCFRFTWLGPNYDNTTNLDPDENCKGLIEKRKLKNVPCRQPLVITYDGSLPNFRYLLDNNRDQVLCKRSKDTSCVKFTYYFNDQIQNVTYMCAKVSALNEGAVTSGCWTEYDEDGLETEVCVCQPYGNIPCNSASHHSFKYLPSIINIFILIYLKIFY